MVPQFQFRQFLFACQARILVKLNRYIEVRSNVEQVACLHCVTGCYSDLIEGFRRTYQ